MTWPGWKWLQRAAALLGALAAGCAAVAPGVGEDWAALLEEVRAFERRIGFVDTGNFVDLTAETGGFPFCGYAPRFGLPYSYEDPAIRWVKTADAEECRALAGDGDVFYGAVEAVGESGTPVTPAMVSGRLDRFLYVVIHEDCHDQFALPYGIEEALCNLITYRAMEGFAAERYRRFSGENRALRRYADEQSRATRAAIAYYGRLADLYQRHARGELAFEALLREREALYRGAASALRWPRAEANDVRLANDMTYSRHYPLLESVHRALGGDLARTMAFFRQVDRAKPSPAEVMQRQRITEQRSLAFVRAYEEAVVDTIRRLLAERGAAGG